MLGTRWGPRGSGRREQGAASQRPGPGLCSTQPGTPRGARRPCRLHRLLPSVALPCAQSKGLSHRSSILVATISKATGDSPRDLSPALSLHCRFPPEHSAGSQSILFCSHISHATREQRASLCLKQGRDQSTVFLAPALAEFWCLPRTAGAGREGTRAVASDTLSCTLPP